MTLAAVYLWILAGCLACWLVVIEGVVFVLRSIA